MKPLVFTLLVSLGLFASTNHTAKVKETLSSGGYTYMKVSEKGKSYWIAMTKREVKIGQVIRYSEQGWMKKFQSKTLNRTFENILFASEPEIKNKRINLADIKSNIMTSKYKKSNTITVAELFKNRKKYAGQTVTVIGQVTKTSTGIMKRNWVHLMDGSRFQNRDDIVFTSPTNIAKEGSIVKATGSVTINKDFGYGYFYPVIVEKSSFKK